MEYTAWQTWEHFSDLGEANLSRAKWKPNDKLLGVSPWMHMGFNGKDGSTPWLQVNLLGANFHGSQTIAFGVWGPG